MQTGTLIWFVFCAVALFGVGHRRLSERDDDVATLLEENGGDAEGARAYLRTTGWVALALSAWCAAIVYWVALAHPA